MNISSSHFLNNVLRVTNQENDKKKEATNSSLKQQLQELQEKLENSQLHEESEICAHFGQMAACNSELNHVHSLKN